MPSSSLPATKLVKSKFSPKTKIINNNPYTNTPILDGDYLKKQKSQKIWLHVQFSGKESEKVDSRIGTN